MIRLTFAMRRRPGDSLEDFKRYWLEQHGTLARKHAESLGIRRYVQAHRLEEELGGLMRSARGGMEEPYDGVAKVWWDDAESLAQAAGSSRGQQAGAALLEDEKQFVDLPRSPMWLAYDYPQVNPTPENIIARPGSGRVNLMFPLRMRADVGFEAGQHYWHTQHGPLIRSLAHDWGILRYVQVHRTETPLEETFRASRSTEVDAYDGHAELWFDRSDLTVTAPERREAVERVVADEAKFIDFDRSSIWFAEEHVLIE